MTTTLALKDILKNPLEICRQRWNDNALAEKKYGEANSLINTIDALKPAQKQKKIEKQECARDFGQAKTSGADLDVLKVRMQQISAELNALEMQQRAIEEALLALFEDDIVAPRLFPLRFDEYCAPYTDAITISEIAGEVCADWDAYVDSHPQASPYHHYQWRNIIADSFGHESFYLVARGADRQIHGVLPLIRLRSFLFGDFAVSVPFFNYGGPLADTADIAEKLMNAAAEIARARELKHLEIRATHKLNTWPARTDKVSMIRRLPTSEALLDETIGAKVRAQIKRARQEYLDIRSGHLDLLDDYYRVFATNMRDLGTPVYGKNFFANILRANPEQAHIVVVYLRGKPVATAFLLGFRDMMEIPWASTLRTVNALNINMLLYREVLGFCIKRGYTYFDFGRSSVDSGTFRFKKQWGAEPIQHYWHYWLPSGGDLPALKPDSPKFKLLVSCWCQLPVSFTKLVGPYIVKYLP